MNLTKQQVFEAVLSERDYQDGKWGGENHDEAHSIADWVIFMNTHVARAMEEVYNLNPTGAMDQIRKVAALAFAAMESKGVRKR